MTKRTKPEIKFVNLHAHDTFSEFDGFGLTETHLEEAYKNGLDAHAITNHGHMNSFTYLYLHSKKMEKEGRPIKPVYGCEVYFCEDNAKADALIEMIEQNESLEKEEKKIMIREARRTRHMVLLAQNQEGLCNLFQLCSESNIGSNYLTTRGKGKPRVDCAMLERLNEGIIATSACLGGVYAGDMWTSMEGDSWTPEAESRALEAMAETSKKMLAIFGDRWYAELQWNRIPEQHRLNQMVIKTAVRFGIPLVSTVDCHYPTKDAWFYRELYKRLTPLPYMRKFHGEMPESIEDLEYELYPKNGDEVWESYQRYSAELGESYDDGMILASIERSHDIAMNRIEVFEPDTTVRLPSFVVPDGVTESAALRKAVLSGMETYLTPEQRKDPVYLERIMDEISVIEDRGFCRYFLTQKAICDEANALMVTGPGRGSAGGCIIAYLLGITQVDPIRWELLFSRFLRRDAKDFPDIDFDVADRGLVRDVLTSKWGEDRVVAITNWSRLKLKSVIKELARYEDIPFDEVNEVTTQMLEEATPAIKKERKQTAGVLDPPATLPEVFRNSPSLRSFLSEHEGLAESILKLNGMIKSQSRHAGGIVIAEDITRYMPVIRAEATKKDKAVREKLGLPSYILQTPWSEGMHVHHLEPMGFLKFDVLGLKTLVLINDCISNILLQRNGERPSVQEIRSFYDQELHPDVIDFRDKSVFENVFHDGKFLGIFQFTETGAQRFVREVRPNNLVELATVTSIFRPGPLSAKVHEHYVEARRGAFVDYECDEVRQVTEPTFGFLVFQEQIAMLAHLLGDGISLDEGNSLRKVLVKKNSDAEEKKEKIRLKFMRGIEKKGLPEKLGRDLWQKFIYFSGYGFCRAHAIAYGMISFQCAYLLTYFPEEWCAAYLQAESKNIADLKDAITNVRSLDYEIVPVDINVSRDTWAFRKTKKGTVRFAQPLTSLKGIGEKTVAEILKHRPFNSIEDILFNDEIQGRNLHRGHLRKLTKVGALDDIIDKRFAGRKHFAHIVDQKPKTEKKLAKLLDEPWEDGEYTKAEEIEQLYELTAVYPLDLVLTREVAAAIEDGNVRGIGEYPRGNFPHAVAWGALIDAKEGSTRNKTPYLSLTFVDKTFSETTVRVWRPPAGWEERVTLNEVYLLQGKKDAQWGWSMKLGAMRPATELLRMLDG